jgi:hypothetical protein
VTAVRSLLQTANRFDLLSDVLDGVESALPAPYEERLSFARSFYYALPEDPPEWETLLGMWHAGFLPASYRLYDIESNGPDDYVSDYDEEFGWDINEPSAHFLNDKAEFSQLLSDRGFGESLPTQYGVVSDGVLVGAGTDFPSLLRDEGELVVKGRTGSRGTDVYICRFEDGAYFLDGTRCSGGSLQNWLSGLDGHLVTEYVHQADYADALFPETPNTIRVVTMHPRDGDPFVAGVAHRFGTSLTGSVDNFSQGGLSAPVREDGRLGVAVRTVGGTVTRHETHPDTDARIEGTAVPGWTDIREEILDVAASVPELPYVGWDLIVTGDGEFELIEGNANPDTDVLQTHGPLLTNPDVRSFYEAHGVV